MSTQDAPFPTAPVIDGAPPHVLIVRAPYYTNVVDGLTAGAARILTEAGATYEIADVAGAYELPQAVAIVQRSANNRYDGYISLGCVVKGDTDHYDHICREAMAGLMRVALDEVLALGNGLLTVSTMQQALDRSAPPSDSAMHSHNKGAEAAVAVLKQISLRRRVEKSL
ncbi:6,7-dimethyl-8-ribityllumazine synthase [Granulibacter bethesdensis]|uniref:6,7-dimethyl-8-ribityllumazine synthase n=1 Tax=Granulibacter bethesdensis TaxID=364410 RepID=A0AAC9KBP5_9PROT|nr:6,7-dimethyl-8-ribityllumazine synthase [Granulibacter bethesdensis]APH54298.1 6,7-dimethyl-8-ribityllumazine synthase [Granulibacter bethesdensis]APH61883.1 6,7-dimethyl-8-ribityllumazine synthase [Granulibacter bethesdensis]